MNLIINNSSLNPTKGVLRAENAIFPCALGRGGIIARKREGDGGTPIGKWRFRKVFYRSDRLQPFHTQLPLKSISPDDGWCDSPGDNNYNRYVRLPYRASAENLWREDELYDIMVVLGHNDVPRVQGAGSAIFMHVAKTGFPPTEGCVALKVSDLKFLLGKINHHSYVHVLG